MGILQGGDEEQPKRGNPTVSDPVSHQNPVAAGAPLPSPLQTLQTRGPLAPASQRKGGHGGSAAAAALDKGTSTSDPFWVLAAFIE